MRNPLTVIGGVVTLVALMVTMVIVFTTTGSEMSQGQKMTVLTLVIGLVANAIPSLLALLKSEATQHDIRNDVVKDKVIQALAEVTTSASEVNGNHVSIDGEKLAERNKDNG